MDRSNSGAFERKRREREERLDAPAAETQEQPTAQIPPQPVPVPFVVSDPVLVRAAEEPVELVDGPSEPKEPLITLGRARELVSQVIKAVATFAGCCLIAAAILIAVKANPSNSLVSLIRHLAQFFDLGFFSLSNPIKQFTGPHGTALTALLNYGIGAVVWFAVGGLVATVVRGKGAGA